MVKQKNKRKAAEDVAKIVESEKTKDEVENEPGSDYESDQV